MIMCDVSKTENNQKEETKFIEETMGHILNVKMFCDYMAGEIMERGHTHDASKLKSPEKETFIEFTPKLKNSTYGSDEYKGFLKDMNVALDHHYKENRHHPEHFKNGIDDMNLVDIMELLTDWKAATLRHDNGDLFKSIEINQKRFGYTDQLKKIFINTAKLLYKYALIYVDSDNVTQTIYFDCHDKVILTEGLPNSVIQIIKANKNAFGTVLEGTVSIVVNHKLAR